MITKKELLKIGYDPIDSAEASIKAQIVDGQWYEPRWGCDSLQYIIDALIFHELLEKIETNLPDDLLNNPTVSQGDSRSIEVPKTTLKWIELAQLANGGKEWQRTNCYCNVSVGVTVCDYCSIYYALKYARSTIAKMKALMEQ